MRSISLVDQVKNITASGLTTLYGQPFSVDDVIVSGTKPEFEGDYTIVLFGLVKRVGRSPEVVGSELGAHLVESANFFSAFNVIKGFLNLTVTDDTLFGVLDAAQSSIATDGSPTQKVMVEYSSPNTNKPLHLGHLRNNFLGWSISEILQATGSAVTKTCIVNDRGVHISKSMIAWQKWGDGATPESTGSKGDHFVGDYYVRFSQALKDEVRTLTAAGTRAEDAEKKAPLMQEAQQMLLDWENGNPEVMDLWKRMNSWVYAGFDATYKRIGTDFHKTYYESETYLLGKDFVEDGLAKGVFFRKEDGSVWIDLADEGLDEKLVLRRDGTSVYITQDLGLAQRKFEEFGYDKSIYVIADEQNYHMKVLKAILKKLGMPYADGIFHLSYGMVELPSGRMKSREGTVVDADDLIDEMVRVAAQKTEESGKVQDLDAEERAALHDTIALGALKFFLLRVDPKKKMIFNPDESIDFHGFTGAFIQYTHARIKSILRKEPGAASTQTDARTPLLKLEKELLLVLNGYDAVVRQAATELNPSVIAIYAFTVAKTYNTFYTEHSVLKAESAEKKQLRLHICRLTAEVIKDSMQLLGIRVPEKM